MAAGEGFPLFVPGDQGGNGPGLIGPGPVDPAADQGKEQERNGRDPEGLPEAGAGHSPLGIELPQEQRIGDVHQHHQSPVQKKKPPDSPGPAPERPGQPGIGTVIMAFEVHGDSFL